MSAVSAMRRDPAMKRVHEALTARGKPAKVALTAVMRKLVVLANVLLKEDRLWTPEPGRPLDAAPEDAREDAGACARAPRTDEGSQPERLAEPPADA